MFFRTLKTEYRFSVTDSTIKHSQEDRATLGKTSANAPSTSDTPTVQITHPTHPLCGQTFAVVPLYGGKMDPRQVLILLPNGEQRLIPQEWTNQVAQPDYPPGVCFLPERLLVLRQRLEPLLAKMIEQAILQAAESEPIPPGGSHAKPVCDVVGTVDPRAARPDHRHSGTDAAASGKPAKGGQP